MKIKLFLIMMGITFLLLGTNIASAGIWDDILNLFSSSDPMPFSITETKTDYGIAENTIWLEVTDLIDKAQYITNISEIFADHELTNQIEIQEILLKQDYQADIYSYVNESQGKYTTFETIDNGTTYYYDNTLTLMDCDYVLDDKSCMKLIYTVIGTETKQDYFNLPILKEKIVIDGLKIEQKQNGISIPLPKLATVYLKIRYTHPYSKTMIPDEINKYNIEISTEDGTVILDPIWFILITNAIHLDENRKFVSNIFNETKELDNIWSEPIYNNEYVRITFEKNLTSKNDVTIYPRTINGTPRIEVYEINGIELIAEFTNLNDNQYNKVFLTNLEGTQNIFDLKIINGTIELDHIIDPAPIITANVTSPTIVYDNTDWNLNLTASSGDVGVNYIGSDDGGNPARDKYYKAQTFLATADGIITSISQKLYSDGSCADYFSQNIWATNGTHPTTLLSEFTNISWGDIPADAPGSWFKSNGSVEVTKGTRYAIVSTAPLCSSPNYVRVQSDSTTPTYADGGYTESADSGSTWLDIYTTLDANFQMTQTPVLVGYTQFYINDVADGLEHNKEMNNNTNTLVATLGSGNFSATNTLIAEFWAGDGASNSSKINSTEATVLSSAEFMMNGIVKDSNNVLVNNAKIIIINQTDNTIIGTTDSNSTGGWNYTVDIGTYLIVAYDPNNSTRDGDADPYIVVS